MPRLSKTRIIFIVLFACVLAFSGSLLGLDTSNDNLSQYLSLGTGKVHASATITKLGTNQNKSGTSPWTALSSLSLDVDDLVTVLEAADSETLIVTIVNDGSEEESYTAGGNNDAIYGVNWRGQTFTTTSAYSITQVSVTISRQLNPDSVLNVGIYAVDGSHLPTGGALTSGSIPAPIIISIPAGVAYINLTSYALSDATEYAIVLSCPDGDASNFINLYGTDPGGYAGGIGVYSDDGGSSWNADTIDYGFTTYSGDADTGYLVQDVVAENAGNVVASVWSGEAKYSSSSYYIVIRNTSIAKAMTAYKVSGLDDNPLDKYTSAYGSGDNPDSGATSTLTQSDEVGFSLIAMEEQTDEKGTWVNDSDHVYDSSYDQEDGTTGSGGASNIAVFSSAEVLSSTDPQAAEQTSTGGNDWAACVVTYEVSAATPDISNTPSTWILNGLTGNGYIDTDTIYYSNPLGDTTIPSSTVIDGECRFSVTNNSGFAVDLYVNCGNFTGGDANMSNSDTGSNGSTAYGGYSYYSGGSNSGVIMKSSGSSVLYNSLADSTTLKWGAWIETQTTEWVGSDSSTATMTISAQAS